MQSTTTRVALVLVMLAAVFAAGCRSTPVAGRRQLMLIPEDQEVAMGHQAYHELLETEPRSTNQQYIEMVNRVGQRIAQAANRPDYQWEFNVIASPQQNAFALPGGKVAVYEGIMPICQDETGLAVVLSHEVAHVLARHGGERMSHDYVVDQFGNAVSYVMRNQEERRRQVAHEAFGITSKYGVLLPYSRKHESEADEIGLRLMAQAGYDPRQAARFWQRFGAASGPQSVPEWASTHPSHDTRASDLDAMVAEVVPIYEAALSRGGSAPGITPPATMTGAANSNIRRMSFDKEVTTRSIHDDSENADKLIPDFD